MFTSDMLHKHNTLASLRYHRSEQRSEPLNELFEQQTQGYGNKIALVDVERKSEWTYSYVIRCAGSFARTLRKRFGFRNGDTVAVYLENRPEFFPIVMGTVSLGGIYCGVNPVSTVDELRRQLTDCEARYVITKRELLPKLENVAKGLGLKHVFLWDVDTGKSKSKAFPTTPLHSLFWEYTESIPSYEAMDPSTTVAGLFYSSGTTGIPKGVQLCHNSLSWFTHLDNMVYSRPSADDNILAITPLFHIAGLGTAIRALCSGAKVHILPKYEPERLCQVIEEYKISMLFCVPPILVFLAKDPRPLRYDLSSLRVVQFGAAPAGVELLDVMKHRYPHITHLLPLYGMTEGGQFTTEMPFIPHSENPPLASVGLVNPGMEIKIISTEGDSMILGPKEIGEICKRSKCYQMLGYKDRPEANAETIDTEGWIHTGDIGCFDSAGYVYVTDRIKDLIKYKGFQIAPAELEDVIMHHPGVLEVGVAGTSRNVDRNIGEFATAFVVPDKNYANLRSISREIVELVASKCSNYKHLRGGVVLIESLPKGPSGKILRRQLRDEFNTGNYALGKSKL